MGQETAKTILIWAMAAFAAGLIGYFGRYLAMMFIDMVRGKKKKKLAEGPLIKKEESHALTTKPEHTELMKIQSDKGIEKEKLKLEKKKAKMEYKFKKKLNKE